MDSNATIIVHEFPKETRQLELDYAIQDVLLFLEEGKQVDGLVEYLGMLKGLVCERAVEIVNYAPRILAILVDSKTTESVIPINLVF